MALCRRGIWDGQSSSVVDEPSSGRSNPARGRRARPAQEGVEDGRHGAAILNSVRDLAAASTGRIAAASTERIATACLVCLQQSQERRRSIQFFSLPPDTANFTEIKEWGAQVSSGIAQWGILASTTGLYVGWRSGR